MTNTEYGAVALVGSGEYLPQMDDVDQALLSTLGDGPHTVALLPTASALEPGMPQHWNGLGLATFPEVRGDGRTVTGALARGRAPSDGRR